jgi:AbrB family looped-hinge helix DNA binding protein
MRSTAKSNKRVSSLIKVDRRRRVVVPKSICDRLGLHEGDTVEMALRNGTAILRPRHTDDDNVLSPEDEKLVRQGERQLRQGKYIEWEDLKKKLKL